MWLRTLLELFPSEVKGPPSSFTLSDVVLSIFLIDKSFIGRKRLSGMLGLGEGATRTIISKLKEFELVSTFASGCKLTDRGLQFFEQMSDTITLFDPPRIVPVKGEMVGAKIKGAAKMVEKGLEERDVAVRAGAEGAIILVVSGDRILMPGLSDLSAEHPEQASLLRSMVKPSDGDVITITWSEKRAVATKACISVAISILRKALNDATDQPRQLVGSSGRGPDT